MENNNKKKVIERACVVGTCPVCGGAYDYTDDPTEIEGTVALNKWRCDYCGATGYEGAEEVFSGFFYVEDAEGNAVEILEIDPAAELKAMARKAADAWRGTDAYHQAAELIDALLKHMGEEVHHG